MGDVMSDNIAHQQRTQTAAGAERRRPDVVGVGAWLRRAKEMRGAVTVYVPRHRAAGPAA
jgi:hypothetical protein